MKLSFMWPGAGERWWFIHKDLNKTASWWRGVACVQPFLSGWLRVNITMLDCLIFTTENYTVHMVKLTWRKTTESPDEAQDMQKHQCVCCCCYFLFLFWRTNHFSHFQNIHSTLRVTGNTDLSFLDLFHKHDRGYNWVKIKVKVYFAVQNMNGFKIGSLMKQKCALMFEIGTL